MHSSLDPVVGAIVLLALWMVGITNLPSKMALYGLQTAGLGILAVWIGVHHHEPALIIAGTAVALLKGIGVPIYLTRVVRIIGCRRDEGLLLAPPLLLFLTMAILGALALLQPFAKEYSADLLPSIGLILVGMTLMISRRLAVSQIVGFLVIENGIFYYTISQPHSMPLVVDLGVLLDVLVGVMLAGALMFQISDSFEHIDVTELKRLRG